MAFQTGRKRKLLAELNKLTHSERVQHMSELGRDRAGTSKLRSLLDSLDGDLHQWQLRLYAARAAGESTDIIAGLAQPLRSVRSLAIASLRTVDVDLDVLVRALTDMSASDRRALLTVVRQRGDTTIADQLIAQVHDRFGANEASTILAACSPTVTAEWLPQLAHAMSNWPRLVRAHPTTFVNFVRAEMSSAPILSDAWWARVAAGISELIEIDPGAVLDLWDDSGPSGSIPGPVMVKLPRLATHDANRTFTLLLNPAHRSELPRLIRRLRRRIPLADDSVVSDLARALAHRPDALSIVLGAVAPSRRTSLFHSATDTTDTSQLSWGLTVMSVLPHDLRHREARRMLALPRHQDVDDVRHELMIWLPIEETWHELRTATQANDATRRAHAYGRLGRAVLASADPAYFDLFLTELLRLRNEQDPVRVAALLPLTNCPVHLFSENYMHSIDELINFAVESRDTSRQTVATLTALVQRVLTSNATAGSMPRLQRCVDALATLAGHRGRLQFGPLHRTLPPGGEIALYNALEPRIQADLQAGRTELLFNLIAALGKRGHAIPQIDAHLAELTQSKNDSIAQQAIRLWLAIPGNRAHKLGELIAHDPSTALLHPVLNLVSLTRQDLLDTALSTAALTGRFAPTSTRQIPMLDSGFRRWNPSQRATYGGLLEAAARNEHTGHHRMRAIRCLARIPEVGTDPLRQFLQDGNVITTEAALAGLSWGETPSDELTTLLSYANSDRARVAVYSATRAARFTPPQQLDQALARVLQADDSKLTSRKEVLRILGQNRTPDALDTFAALWAERPLHRSIAIALASALRNYPTSELTWHVYEELATGETDTAFAVAQSLHPLTWPQNCRSRVAALGAPLVGHDHASVRTAAWSNLALLRPWSSDISSVISDAIVDLSTVNSWRLAVRQLHLLLDGYPDDPVLADTTKRLANAQVTASIADDPGRDLPIHQRIEALGAAWPTSTPAKATMRAAAEHLVEAGYHAQATRFVAAGVDWSAPEIALHRLVDLGTLHANVVPQLYAVTSDVLETGSHSGLWAADDLLPIAQTLATGNEAAGLVASALVAVVGPMSGWSEPWRELLDPLRTHDSPWVQHHARGIRTATE